MRLFSTIDGLLAGTRYMAWGLGALGIVGSVVLFLANIPLGIGAAAVFIASFFLAVGVTLLLLPRQIVNGESGRYRRYITGGISLVIAAAVMGMVWMMNGGLPVINLIFA